MSVDIFNRQNLGNTQAPKLTSMGEWGNQHLIQGIQNQGHFLFSKVNPTLTTGTGGTYPDKIGGNMIKAASGKWHDDLKEYRRRLDLSRRQVIYNSTTRTNGSAPLHTSWAFGNNFHIQRAKYRDINLVRNGLFY